LNGQARETERFLPASRRRFSGAAVPERVGTATEIMKPRVSPPSDLSHPYAPEFLDLCDKLGFLVMNEMFDEWKQDKTANGYGNYFDEWWSGPDGFVRRDRNHPSVLLWSLGNEIGEQAAINGVEMLKRLLTSCTRRTLPISPPWVATGSAPI